MGTPKRAFPARCLAGLIFVLPLVVRAADYYVDSAAGNDINAGTSASAPWKTLAKVNASTFTFGSTVFLKRGSAWHESIIVPSSGLTIDAYGSGAAPVLDSSVAVSGWTAAAPSQQGGAIYASPAIPLQAPGVGALGNITENGVMMTLVPWSGSPALTLGAAAYGSYTYDYGAGRIYIKSSANPAASGRVYLASTLLYGVSATGKTDITVQNLDITRFSLHGIQFASCVRCAARNLAISNGGGAEVALQPIVYAGNGLEWSGDSSAGAADQLNVSNVLDSGISAQTFSPSANQISAITISNSSVEGCGFAGVELSALSSSGPGASISNVAVSNLSIVNTGHGWSGDRYGNSANGIRVVADQGAGTMSGISISATTVVNSVGYGADIENDVGAVSLDRVRFSANATGIYAFANTGFSHSLKISLGASILDANRGDGLFYNAPSSAGFLLFDNTFYGNTGDSVHVRGQSGAAYIQDNLFAGTSKAQLYVENYVGSQKVLYGAEVGNNCYTQSAGMIYYNGASYSSLTAFRAATGLEQQGIQGLPTAANATGLGLVNPAAGNFGLSAGSPCVAAGVTGTGVPVDYLLNPYKAPPSIGAVQYEP